MKQNLILTVSQLSQQIKDILESSIINVEVQGEVIAPKIHSSGHIYFTLKDIDASIDCIIWKYTKIPSEITEGMQIVCSGYVTSYPARSKYQFIVKKVVLDGIGYILNIIETLKKTLIQEGLLDRSRKLPIPAFPQRIGIITSSTGAVLHDMMHRLQDRYPCNVLLYHANVQGNSAVAEIIDGLHVLQNQVDVIIIARGGGSFNDLLCFHDETLVRNVDAISTSITPIVTAIGHETDTTLVDYASSLRAPTPTAAIEMITPDRKELLRDIKNIEDIISSIYDKIYDRKQYEVESVSIKINNITHHKYQLIANASHHTIQYLYSKIHTYKKYINQYDTLYPRFYIKDLHKSLILMYKKIHDTYLNQYNMQSLHLDNISNLLDAYSYKKTLKRGYCIAKLGSVIITSKEEIRKAKKFCLMFDDGIINIEKK